MAFYGEVFGWKVTTVPMGENYTYYLVHNGNDTYDIDVLRPAGVEVLATELGAPLWAVR